MTSPLVSIVTPVYNAADFLQETIDSVRAQSFLDWEWLLIDDASTDATPDLLARVAADPRLKWIAQPHNQGPAKARARGLALARGRYIAFLDSDDVWLPEKLTRQLQFMQEKDAALSHTAYRRFRGSSGGGEAGRLITPPALLTYRRLLGQTAIAMSTAMIDREKTGPFKLADHPVEDFILWLDLTKRGFAAHGLGEDLARYRLRKGNWSGNPLRNMARVWDIYRNHEKLALLDAAFCFLSYGTRATWRRLFS